MVYIALVTVTMKSEYHIGSTSCRQILPLMFSNSCFYHELMASCQPPKYYGGHQHNAGTSIMMNTTVMVVVDTIMIPKDVHSCSCLYYQCVSLTVRIIKKRVSNRRPDLEHNLHGAMEPTQGQSGSSGCLLSCMRIHIVEIPETGTEVSREEQVFLNIRHLAMLQVVTSSSLTLSSRNMTTALSKATKCLLNSAQPER